MKNPKQKMTDVKITTFLSLLNNYSFYPVKVLISSESQTVKAITQIVNNENTINKKMN